MEKSTGHKSFNDLSDELKQKIVSFNEKEANYKNLRLIKNLDTLNPKIAELQDWISEYTNIYNAIFIHAMKEDADGHRKKALEVTMMMINKIQYIYLMPATEQEGVLKDKKNLNVAYGGIILSILLAVFSIFYPIWDGRDSQNKMFNYLQQIRLLEQKISNTDSVLNKKMGDTAVLKNQVKIIPGRS